MFREAEESNEGIYNKTLEELAKRVKGKPSTFAMTIAATTILNPLYLAMGRQGVISEPITVDPQTGFMTKWEHGEATLPFALIFGAANFKSLEDVLDVINYPQIRDEEEVKEATMAARRKILAAETVSDYDSSKFLLGCGFARDYSELKSATEATQSTSAVIQETYSTALDLPRLLSEASPRYQGISTEYIRSLNDLPLHFYGYAVLRRRDNLYGTMTFLPNSDSTHLTFSANQQPSTISFGGFGNFLRPMPSQIDGYRLANIYDTQKKYPKSTPQVLSGGLSTYLDLICFTEVSNFPSQTLLMATSAVVS